MREDVKEGSVGRYWGLNGGVPEELAYADFSLTFILEMAASHGDLSGAGRQVVTNSLCQLKLEDPGVKYGELKLQ